jgi:hypothetical protein
MDGSIIVAIGEICHVFKPSTMGGGWLELGGG